MEWWISRLCEEFHCLPSQALREWQEAPDGLLETIVEMRAFAATKAAYDAATDKESMPKSPLADLVKELDFGRADRTIAARAERWLERRKQSQEEERG